MRIHVMGPPGGGKTTLARQLASSLNIPFYELDTIAWEEGYPCTERSLEARLSDINRIAAQSAWVTEGIFLVWTDELLRSADHIVWLDLSWPRALTRIIIRRLRRSLARENPPSGILKQLQFLRYIGSYYFSKKQIETRIFTARHLMLYKNKLSHCRCPSDVEAFITAILAQQPGEKAKQTAKSDLK
jgi:adenylate kinase family enzyme